MLLKLDNIHTHYGNIRALKGISFNVNEGEIVCLIGANGAGKSTSLMTISGVLVPNEGDILYMGNSIIELRPDNIVQMGICQVPEGRMIFPVLTVKENLDLGAYLRNDPDGVNKDIESSFLTEVLSRILYLPLIKPLTLLTSARQDQKNYHTAKLYQASI